MLNRTKNHKFMGPRYDGGKSPLGNMSRLGNWDDKLLLSPPAYTPGGYNESLEMDRLFRGAFPGDLDRTLAEASQSTDPYRKFRLERGKFHKQLRAWAEGPLRLEHPQGSSLHHLIEYDCRTSNGEWAEITRRERTQIFVVERDWARAFAGYDLTQGEVPLPFPHCIYEFRISGVRVLAFFWDDPAGMHCVYGGNNVWVSDDYYYDFRTGRSDLVGNDVAPVEFPRVNKLVMDNVRIANIMVDAGLTETMPHKASPKLVERAVKTRKAPPRDYLIIDLKKPRRRFVIGASADGSHGGYKQRGHPRRGTWVHYDDPDSGEVPYVDSGGFWHSRTWRHWHFAGDLSNMIEREYRL